MIPFKALEAHDMGKQLSSAEIRLALRVVMKKQGRAYIDLAKFLQVSLPTVKRFMSKDEMQVGRLLEICDWLEISISDLEKIARVGGQDRVTFTEQQEKFFAENPNYMSFLFHMYASETPEKIQSQYALSKKSLELYLIRLERLELIKKKSGQYVTVHKEFPKLIPFGLLSKKQTDQVLTTGVEIFKRYNRQQSVRRNSELDRGSTNSIIFCEVSRESYLAWFEKFKELNMELQRLSEIQEYQTKIKDKKLIGMMHLHGVFEINDPEVHTLKNMFGRVTNLTV